MTPDERREAHIAASWRDCDPDASYDALLAYFDEHEPAVADAIRYGVSNIGASLIQKRKVI